MGRWVDRWVVDERIDVCIGVLCMYICLCRGGWIGRMSGWVDGWTAK